MCKVGDIIVVREYIAEDGVRLGQHSFVVLEDEEGNIQGISYDLVANVMSSIKNEEHKLSVLQHKENLLITEANRTTNPENHKEAFIKADQLYYFKKDKLTYFVIGNVDELILNTLFEVLENLDKEGKIRTVIHNLVEA